jgi:hypothetical protein
MVSVDQARKYRSQLSSEQSIQWGGLDLKRRQELRINITNIMSTWIIRSDMTAGVVVGYMIVLGWRRNT